MLHATPVLPRASVLPDTRYIVLRFVITSFSARLVQGIGPKPSGKERRNEQHLHLYLARLEITSPCTDVRTNQPWLIRLRGTEIANFIMENTDALKNVQVQMNGNEMLILLVLST